MAHRLLWSTPMRLTPVLVAAALMACGRSGRNKLSEEEQAAATRFTSAECACVTAPTIGEARTCASDAWDKFHARPRSLDDAIAAGTAVQQHDLDAAWAQLTRAGFACSAKIEDAFQVSLRVH